MAEETRSPGKTTIAPAVLLSIAHLTTMDVKGVSSMYEQPQMTEIFQRGHRGDGVRVMVEGGKVYADLHVVLDQDVNIRQVSREIQQEVARAITEMVGLEVGEINVHIEDVNFATE
jgi:uncharacterized alkaline shock family protein YloU